MFGVQSLAAAAGGGLDLGNLQFGFGEDLAGEAVEVGAQAGRLDGGAGSR